MITGLTGRIIRRSFKVVFVLSWCEGKVLRVVVIGPSGAMKLVIKRSSRVKSRSL